ncbi:Rrf2 family transcriptional regulator [Synechococcus sp. CS-602]|nr:MULTISPECIES: Rrf2 family transcriptional regulator [Synechococcaceae]MCT0246901.1 Rrf2 family transcriptional regulator [Synechococcus sp. CS-601]MCT4365798.1 Rrf2 family transcriptional regulator [Candidatus Regnicoccus frigidus MAG-AL1]TWB91814.1 BadM/Rrf2 family transcriptional regulator [Synechococcus sp. Ace-Pa]MCT0201015.1 Rrf2 family transcriptional regulator [Synechococcus sp. CS-603]MCT0205562.1 Rrf2 family transcriptional regulator [Synechococcus sp. CS-602]
MLKRRGLQAIQALLELALEPERWRSGPDLASSQEMPAPMLEQVLLLLRRAGLVEARRGRSGGYRLSRKPAAISLVEVLRAVGADPAADPVSEPAPDSVPESVTESVAEGLEPGPELAGERVAQALERRLRLALERELALLSLEELVYDLRSWQEYLREDGGLMLG